MELKCITHVTQYIAQPPGHSWWPLPAAMLHLLRVLQRPQRIFNVSLGEAGTTLTLPQFMMVVNAIVRYHMPECIVSTWPVLFKLHIRPHCTNKGRRSKGAHGSSEAHKAVGWGSKQACATPKPCLDSSSACSRRFAAEEKQLLDRNRNGCSRRYSWERRKLGRRKLSQRAVMMRSGWFSLFGSQGSDKIH